MAPRATKAKVDDEAATNGYRGAHLQSLQRGIAVLFHVAGAPTPLSAREISEALGIERTITHRILRTLETENLVFARDGRYGVGPRSVLLGQAYLDHLVVRQVAMPFEVDLLFRTFAGKPWSVGLSLAVEDQLTIIDQLWAPTAPLNTIMSIGTRLPLEQTSAGRAILAYMEEGEVIAAIGEDRARAVEDRLAEVRAAVGVEFTQDAPHAPPGIVALGAVILNRSGRPIAGLSMSGPGMEDHLDLHGEVAVELRRTAEQVGRACP